MGISDKNINFRASEDTLKEIGDIQTLFHPFLPDRSTTLRWIVKKFWELLFTDTNLIETLRQWQAFSGNIGQRAVTQLSIKFPRQDGINFFPRIHEVAQ